MKAFLIALSLSVIPAAALANGSSQSTPSSGRMVSHYDCIADPALLNQPLKKTFASFKNIFLGEIVKIGRNAAGKSPIHENECWARLAVTESFKQERPVKEYYAIFYSEPRMPKEAESLLKPYCSAQRGEKYVIFTGEYTADVEKGSTSIFLVPGCSMYLQAESNNFILSLLRSWARSDN